jgi:hypothetical protein
MLIAVCVVVAVVVAGFVVTIWSDNDGGRSVRVRPAQSSNAAPPPVLDAFEGFAPEGPLLSSSSHAVLVQLSAGRVLRVRVTPTTVYCRAEEGCSAQRSDLRVGDVVTATMNGKRAHEIAANFVATDVEVDAISDNTLTVHGVRQPTEPNPPYTLIIGPSTIREKPSANPQQPVDNQSVGSDPTVSVGQHLYYTGFSATPLRKGLPEAGSMVYAARIFDGP